MKKRIVSIILCMILLCLTVTSVSSCSKPPEYAEVEARFKELVEASYDVNKLLFGEGLPTYERIYEAVDEVYKSEGEGGKMTYIYYHYLEDASLGKILSYKKGTIGSKRLYLQVLSAADSSKGEAVYVDTQTGEHYYALENYSEPEYEFYYSANDPDNYDFVRYDSGYLTVDDIKIAAEKVYSKDYLETSVYVALFTGAVINQNLSGFSARYIEYSDAVEGDVRLMMSNEYEPLITETRKFDFSTARVVKPGSKDLVNIEVETYLESKPDERVTVRVTMVKQDDGQWYLDSGTY
ncbi:MAG: hypothetical protein E7653_01720 [Ruminococcaceae bacterium]|nr:hypothetical protein [Oscillospiraceae bacterium]